MSLWQSAQSVIKFSSLSSPVDPATECGEPEDEWNCRNIGIASRHDATLRRGVCDKNLGLAEVSVVVVEDQPLHYFHVFHEFRFLRIRKQ